MFKLKVILPLDGSVHVCEDSLYRSEIVQKQLAAAKELAGLLGLIPDDLEDIQTTDEIQS